jgi:hypothetical protein
VFAILLCFRNQEIQSAVSGIPIQLGVTALPPQGVNPLGDPGKLILAKTPLLYRERAIDYRREI